MMRTSIRSALGTVLVFYGILLNAINLPASNPVGIARSGVGVAYGNNLEAVSVNPSLAVTLRNQSSCFISTGIIKQSNQISLQSHNRNATSTNSPNHLLNSFGFVWHGNNSKFGFGLKFDEPVLINLEIESPYAGQHLGKKIAVSAKRIETQFALALSTHFALGFGFDIVKTSSDWQGFQNIVNDNEIKDISYINAPFSDTTNCYKLGFRWAINPSWTIGGTYLSPVKASTKKSAFIKENPEILQNCNSLVLPDKFTVGTRQRVNTFFTWELDIHYTLASKTRYWPQQFLCSKSIFGQIPNLKDYFSFGLASELNISRKLTLRLGSSFDAASMNKTSVSPMFNGAPLSCLSSGFGYKIFGGEVNMGYQFRKIRNIDTDNLHNLILSNGKYITTKTNARIEGMGHIFSIGFKKVI